MNIEIKGTVYEILMCSDVQRDGMYLEASIPGMNSLNQIAEVFYSDQTHEFVISCFQENVPLELVELLIREARQRLPADNG
jgi:hypothetical protein